MVVKVGKFTASVLVPLLVLFVVVFNHVIPMSAATTEDFHSYFTPKMSSEEINSLR